MVGKIMALASYTENIVERLNEARQNFAEELSSLRARLANSDADEREAIGKEIVAIKGRLNRFLDEMEKRSKKLFDEAISRLSDHRIDVFRHIEKKEKQTADARKERDQAIGELSGMREKFGQLRKERDQAIRRNKELTKLLNDLSAENRVLKAARQDKDDWKSATSGVKRRQ